MTTIALVTGARGGIGSALARQLHANGFRVAAVGRDIGRLRARAAVFASSVVARIGVANHEATAAARGGVEALVRSAADQEADANAWLLGDGSARLTGHVIAVDGVSLPCGSLSNSNDCAE